MERDQLIDLTRRAVKLARDKTTDLAPAEHAVQAGDYTSIERHKRDVEMLMASPQLVGYVSELPEPGSVLHQNRDGPIGPADQQRRRDGQGVQQHLPAPAVASGHRLRHREAVHLPLPRMDLRQHRQTGRAAGTGRLPGACTCAPTD